MIVFALVRHPAWWSDIPRGTQITIHRRSRFTSRVEKVTAQLRALIQEKDRLQGGRLPSEPALSDLLGASRATVRQALVALEIEGLIVRKRGIGTFVNSKVQGILTRLEEVWDFDEMIRLSGHQPSAKFIEVSLGPADAKIAETLALPPGSEVLATTDVFLADGVPVIYCKDTIPGALVRSAYTESELRGPIYGFLETRCGQRVEFNITDLVPIVADARLAELLECPVGAPLLYLEELGFNSEAVPVVWSQEYYRPEYFSFKVVRKRTTARL